MNAIAAAWYRFVAVALARLHYRRITLLGAEHVPARGPVLYVALHRNGAMDGAVYAAALPRVTFMIAARLRRSALGRLLFGGIAVERAKDLTEAHAPDRADARASNARSLSAAARHVADGHALLVFPEGTSDLGPRHLPFQPGAARILAAALERAPSVTVVPLGVHYFAPACYRSDAIVVAGPPVSTPVPEGTDERARIGLLHERIGAALESLAVEAPTAEDLARIERLAALHADGDPRRYRAALVALAHGGLPADAAPAWADVARAVDDGSLVLSFGAPAFSRRTRAWSVAWVMVQAPFVALAAILNAGPVLAGVLGARRADARNTVALHRAIFGALSLVPWAVALLAGCVAARRPALWFAYLAATALGVALYPELRARLARLRSAPAARALRPLADAALASLAERLPASPPAARVR